MEDRLEKLESEVKKVIQLSKEFNKRNGNKKIRITKEQFNLWVIDKMMDQDVRIAKLEAKQKMLIWIIGLSVPTIGFVCGLIKVSA
jgi:hypothetical protein